MDITPLIPDGYTGPMKRLTCSICKHMFYITQDNYHRHPEVRFCHECSLILREELEKTQGASTLTPSPVREKPVARAPLPSSVAPIQPIPLPQPRIEPENAYAYDELGDILSKLERFTEAVKAYNQALRLMPDLTRAYQSKAHALEKLGQYEQALAAYNKALQLHPKNGHLLFSRAGVLKKLLWYEEANADYLSVEMSAQAAKSDPLLDMCCIIADLTKVAEAKARLQAAGKEVSDEAIEAEIHLMYQEQKIASLKSSPLFAWL